MSRPKNKDPIRTEELQTYLEYVLTGEVKDEKHAKDLKRLSRRTTTLSDVVTVAQVLLKQQERLITSLIDANQIHHNILKKLGMTDEMFQEANDEYNETIKAAMEDLKRKMEEKGKEDSKKEDE